MNFWGTELLLRSVEWPKGRQASQDRGDCCFAPLPKRPCFGESWFEWQQKILLGARSLCNQVLILAWRYRQKHNQKSLCPQRWRLTPNTLLQPAIMQHPYGPFGAFLCSCVFSKGTVSLLRKYLVDLQRQEGHASIIGAIYSSTESRT